jgi:bifunctional UDP-N-acetylglucosamine pyrophosphorylase / glucosamine-1-phosphate N-acetyltransferase
LNFPKTLFVIQGKPILVRIFELLRPYDKIPTVIVSPNGEDPICKCLAGEGFEAHLVVQPRPRGMGDAVLQFAQSPAFDDAEHVLLIWGDVPFIQADTVAAMVAAHGANGNDFTFVTRIADQPYTVVSRGPDGGVTRIVETREEGVPPPVHGERDIGLFIFRKTPVMNLLRRELRGKWGKSTGEHGFLYVIDHLVEYGLNVQALPIAKDVEVVSLNRVQDVSAFV